MFCLNLYLCNACMPGDHRGQRGCWTPWYGSYRQFEAAMLVLGIEIRSSIKATLPLSRPSSHGLSSFYPPFKLFFIDLMFHREKHTLIYDIF